MSPQSDEVFFLDPETDQLRSLPIRSMRSGLLGKRLEDALQALLQKYPQVIPGKQIEPASGDPPRFIHLQHEMPVGGGSLDHLYVDQRGILTLVETKLAENPESRRAVIGQIIEYAAYATELWTIGQIREYANEFWNKQGRDLNEALLNEFGDSLDIEDFWSMVEANLRDGRIRLIIASDELQPEVRRMIEYLNRKMQNTQVLGLELKCYGEESKSLVLVPRLIGQTQASADRRSPGNPAVQWTADKLKAAFGDPSRIDTAQGLQRALDWVLNNHFFIESKTQSPSFGIRGKGKYRILTVFSSGDMYLFFEQWRYSEGNKERDELINELKALRFLDQDIDPQQVVSGRSLARKITELKDNEFVRLLDVLYKFCG